ncbi:MAG: hypothetical protein SOV91_02925, partial [Eubacteriales bacterium]|nr:hypothetical protein [Eubacteriales bacterium]
MVYYIYGTPLLSVIALMIIALLSWGVLGKHIAIKCWKRTNLLLSILALAAILYTTVFSRPSATGSLILTPFAAFAAAQQQPELYREML